MQCECSGDTVEVQWGCSGDSVGMQCRMQCECITCSAHAVHTARVRNDACAVRMRRARYLTLEVESVGVAGMQARVGHRVARVVPLVAPPSLGLVSGSAPPDAALAGVSLTRVLQPLTARRGCGAPRE